MRLLNYSDENMYFHHAYDDNPRQKDYHLHTHSTNYTIFYLIQGQGSYMVEGYEYAYRPDSLIIMRPNEVRKHLVDSRYAFERALFYFSDAVLASIDPGRLLAAPFLDRPLGVGNQYFSHELQYHLPQLIRSLCQSRPEEPYFRTKMLATLGVVLMAIYEAFQRRKDAPPQPVPLPARIVGYVNDNIYENLTMDQIAARFYISSAQLWRIFKEATGYAPGDYIRLKRVSEARRLIEAGVPVHKAAAQCGYSDYSAFFRAYKREFHQSPTGRSRSPAEQEKEGGTVEKADPLKKYNEKL